LTTLADLQQDPENARQHNPRNIGMITSALHEVGAARSIVVDEDNVILAGNGVYEAAAQAGIENVQVVEANGETIIAVKRTGLTPEQKKRLALFDNRTAELADWNVEQIVANLDAGVSLDGIFGDDELKEMLEGFADGLLGEEPPEPQIDKAEELREKWGVELGQLWRIPSKKGGGEHRIVCGDCTDAEVVERVMGGEKAALLWTDPPYHVGKTFGAYDEGIEWDALMQKGWLDAAVEALRPEAQRYICFAQARSREAILTYEPKRILVWCKPFALMRSNSWDWAYEFVAWCYDTDEPAYFDKPQGTASFDWQEIASVIHGQEGRHHITQKPIALSESHINASCRQGETVYDPFLGSGTTLVACERLGRFGRGIEVSPAYVGVSLERLSDMGLQPERVGLSQGVSTGSTEAHQV